MRNNNITWAYQKKFNFRRSWKITVGTTVQQSSTFLLFFNLILKFIKRSCIKF